MELSYDEIVDLIIKETSLSKDKILSKISDKVSELEGLVSKEGAAHIIANELGVSLVTTDASSDFVEIKNLVGGIRNVIVVGRVLEVYPVNTFEKNGKEGKVGSLLLGDGTGFVRVVFWNEQIKLLKNVSKGDILKVINTYVKENKFGKLELHVSYRSKVRINPDDVDSSSFPSETKISNKSENIDLVELEKNMKIRVSGMIVQVFKKNVFFTVCPECNKSIKPTKGVFVCPEHGKVEPERRVFLTYVVDDGTDNVRCVSFGDDAEKLIGADTEKLIELADENEDDSYPVEHFYDSVVGKEVIIYGRGVFNDFSDSIEIITNNIIYPIDFLREVKRVCSEYEYGDKD